MKKPIAIRAQILLSLVKNEINTVEAARILGCTNHTVSAYLRQYLTLGIDGLVDHRKSNHYKLTKQQKEALVKLKQAEPWRSPRSIRDKLALSVHETTVWRLLVKAGLGHENTLRVKAITRFEADNPNDLWQTDIMGKITFKVLGDLYLIATLDDHSRFIPYGKWFTSQNKMNVFNVWYESLSNWGIPKAMLQDEGSQYKARVRFGQADYEWYAKQLGIKLIWASTAQCKGKIERFWKFVQKDFVPGIIKARTLDEVNGAWRLWLAWYNYKFKSRTLGNETHAARYRTSDRRLKRVELETLLLIEERRKVTRESTISLYGKHYYVPPGYIGCRIWVQIKGNKLHLEANGNIFHVARLRF